jgi:hypothetical protein
MEHLNTNLLTTNTALLSLEIMRLNSAISLTTLLQLAAYSSIPS